MIRGVVIVIIIKLKQQQQTNNKQQINCLRSPHHYSLSPVHVLLLKPTQLSLRPSLPSHHFAVFLVVATHQSKFLHRGLLWRSPTLLVETFAGRNFRGDKLSRTQGPKINFRGYKLSRMEEILAKFFHFHAIF